jgi:hypothetical protein
MEVTFERETPRERNSYFAHEKFVAAVNNYAKHLNFQARLGKVKRNSAGKISKEQYFVVGKVFLRLKKSNSLLLVFVLIFTSV